MLHVVHPGLQPLRYFNSASGVVAFSPVFARTARHSTVGWWECTDNDVTHCTPSPVRSSTETTHRSRPRLLAASSVTTQPPIPCGTRIAVKSGLDWKCYCSSAWSPVWYTGVYIRHCKDAITQTAAVERKDDRCGGNCDEKEAREVELCWVCQSHYWPPPHPAWVNSRVRQLDSSVIDRRKPISNYHQQQQQPPPPPVKHDQRYSNNAVCSSLV